MVRFTVAPVLPDWLSAELPFPRRMVEVDGQWLHFIDHGKGPAVLLMHGNPTWCFLRRRVIARLPDVRVIAPDLLGLWLSSKPRRTWAHQLQYHIELQRALVAALDLPDFVAVGQDWGVRSRRA